MSPGADFAGMETPIRIVIAEDHLIARVGVKTIINTQPDMSVVGEAANGSRRWSCIRKHRPDVASDGCAHADPERSGGDHCDPRGVRGCPYHRAEHLWRRRRIRRALQAGLRPI